MKNNLKNFVQFVEDVLEHSYGQRMQDLWAIWESGFKTDGYFVEFGALNGRDFSNSYTLEKLGWDGALSEPHPDFAERVKSCRDCYFTPKCVYSKSNEKLTFHLVRGRPAMSSIGTLMSQDDKAHLRSNFVECEVDTISLTDMLQEAGAPKEIDFLSIDTEGSELTILEAYDFESFQINLICVEHNNVLRQEIYDLLISKGYQRKFEAISGHDDYYVLDGAYQNWGVEGQPMVTSDLKKIPPFENQIAQRQGYLSEYKTIAGLG